MEHRKLYLTTLSLCTFIAMVAAETDVAYWGHKSIRDKDGVKINRARWTLSPTQLERPGAKQDCTGVKRQPGLDAGGSNNDWDETILRCSTDDESPYISGCPTNITSCTDPGHATALVTWSKLLSVDDVDPKPKINCMPLSGYQFSIGNTNVVCEARDRNVNKATCEFNVSVTDNEAPEISVCPSNISSSTDPGLSTARITWSNLTAVDNSDSNPVIYCTPSSGYQFNIGKTEVVCEARDSSVNSATCKFSVNIIDDEPPNISTCPSDITRAIDPGRATAIITWTNPSADDNDDLSPTVTCTPKSGSEFAVGKMEVVCEAVDGSRNKDKCRFNVTCYKECQKNQTNDIGYVSKIYNSQFDFLWPRVPKNTYYFTFSVQGSNDAFLILSPTDQPINDSTGDAGLPKILIGGWSNSMSSFDCNSPEGFPRTFGYNTSNILSANEARDFYASWADDILAVGRVGEEPFMSYPITCPVEVNYIGVAAGSNHNWTFCGFGEDCNTLRSRYGYNDDGVYSIYLSQSNSFVDMYCDMSNNNASWIVFQKRFNGSVDFNRNWANYTKGFGSLAGEFWWGLENLRRLTAQGSWQLRVDLEDWENNTAYAEYDMFALEGPLFNLSIGAYINGNAGNGLKKNNGQAFSTFDMDNDDWRNKNCAVRCHGGGWHLLCCGVNNLNGKYYDHQSGDTVPIGLLWRAWKNKEGIASYSLKTSQMKLRRTDTIY